MRRPRLTIFFMQEKSDKLEKNGWKFFGISHNLFKFSVFISFLGWILLVFYWMYDSYFYKSPFVPNGSDLQGTALYGQNMEGDLESLFTLFLIENTIALAVLLPYSFTRFYWIRALILQMLFGGWMFLLLLGAMHNSSIYMLNLFGIFGVNILIFILLISSFAADIKNLRKDKFDAATAK